MGVRQSKRSVDITTTPKKEGLPAEGGVVVVGDEAAPGDGKLERIEEADSTKPITNGIAPHTDVVENKEDKDKDEATEKDKEQQVSRLNFILWPCEGKRGLNDDPFLNLRFSLFE